MTKPRLTAIAASLLLAGLMALAPLAPAGAQADWMPPRIAVVDMQGILREAAAAQAARAQMDKIAGEIQVDLNGREEQLRQEEQALQQQRAILSTEAFAERRQAWQQKAAGLQREARTIRGQLDESFKGAMRQVQTVLIEEISTLSRERGVNLVLPRSQIVIAANELDLTTEAMARLNARLPTVTVDFKAEPAQ